MSGKLLLGSKTGKVHIGYLRHSRRFGPGVDGQVLDSCCATLVTPCGNYMGQYDIEHRDYDPWRCSPDGMHKDSYSTGFGLYNLVLASVVLSGNCMACINGQGVQTWWKITHQPNSPIDGHVFCIQPGMENRFAQGALQLGVTGYGSAGCTGNVVRTATSNALVIYLGYAAPSSWRLLVWYELPYGPYTEYGGDVIVFDKTISASFVATPLSFTNPNQAVSCSNWYPLVGQFTELALLAGIGGTAEADGLLKGAQSFWAQSTSNIKLMDNVGAVVQTADNCYQVVRRGLTHAPVTDLDIKAVYPAGECQECGCALDL